MAEDNNKKQTSLRGGTKQSASLEHTTDRLPHSVRNDEHETSLRGTKQSAQSNTLPLLPILRFKEFDGEWNSNLLGKFSSKIGSGSTPTGGNQVYQDSGIPFIRSQNVFDDKLFLDGTHISKILHLKMKGSTVKPNDILLNITGGSIGRSCVVPKDFYEGNVNQHVCIIRLKDNFNANFIQSFLSSHKGQKLIYEGQTGSGREGINFQSIRLFKINIPSLPEQHKIASFLSAVDEKIQQLSKKKALLEQYKKGVMQQLFSGKLRFKDENGEDFPDWEEKQLIDVAKRVVRKNKENNLNVLTISAQLGLISQLEYFNKSVSAKNVTKYYLLHKDEFAYNKSYSSGYPMGAIKRLKRYDKGVVSTLYICFEFNDKVSLDFMEQYFEFGKQNIELEKVAQEGARNHGLLNIGVNDFLNIDLKLPSLSEQQKIANYLSAIDTKIETVNRQIEKTQSFKKGLLQQMFV
ncbi:restriction endonuclease subunit S [Maribacter sp. LLG6340-A2]|uniref:restriction endonuclease subunit S n=1 Tax=Maribacter sp. LLG6340-A2 TaxID=3160834 RepID=UPI003868A0FC